MTEQQIKEAKHIAKSITDELGGYGLFGVELFLTEDKVYFSEVSPRPHDTGLVTLVTQNLSEFALHVRAVLGFPIPEITQLSPGASRPLKAPKELADYAVEGLEKALAVKALRSAYSVNPSRKLDAVWRLRFLQPRPLKKPEKERPKHLVIYQLHKMILKGVLP